MSRKELEGIIKKLLGIEYELDDRTSLIKYGGDSLFFGRLQIELKRTFGLKVPIQQLFQNGTIEQLCKVLGIEEHNGEKIDITDLQTAYLYGRKPEMILGGKGSRAYFSFEVEDVDIARLQKAIKNLVEEQEALRCTFHEDQYANVQESQEIDFTYYDLQILSSKEKDEKLEEIRKDLFERNFNINKGPLICFVATRIDDKKTIVHICHDGLVADGESHQIILKELENLYYGKQNASHCSFSEYTHYIKDMKENPEYSELLNEKVKRLSEFDTKPQLDALKDAKEVMKPNVGVVARIIPEDLYFKICEKGRENAVTPFSILLTAFGKALAKYSDNSKFLLNLENEIPSAEIGKEALEENSETMLINTSGTTGMPKTVILTWRGIMNCINATQKLFSITSKDVAFGVTNYGHDMSIFDILGMVYIGGTTVIPNQHNYKNPEIWIDLMNKYKVTVWISVPALLEMLLYSDLEKLPEVVGKLHRVIQGGDYLHIDIVKKFRKWNQKGKIFNVGGPTETTMWNIYHEVSGEDIQNNNIPYGKPFPNTQYYILDKKQELCPVGKEGQMYIAGDGVTPGYVGTGEQGKFTEYKGLRVYCSGDYGVYMRTGEILFRGRKDRQIKINGKRIELDGIEEKLNSIKGITKGAVICKDKRIVAYYVAEDKTEVNNIKKILSGILPEYMIPTAFYEIKRLPYNRNKKVDYRELERMVPKTGEQEKAETELEDFVARICENIFEVEKIGVKESFYNLGGDSVTAMRIAAIIKKEFNVHMTPYDIFEHSTIRELASYIAKLRSDINEKV